MQSQESEKESFRSILVVYKMFPIYSFFGSRYKPSNAHHSDGFSSLIFFNFFISRAKEHQVQRWNKRQKRLNSCRIYQIWWWMRNQLICLKFPKRQNMHKKIEDLLYANLSKFFVFFFIPKFVCDIFGGYISKWERFPCSKWTTKKYTYIVHHAATGEPQFSKWSNLFFELKRLDNLSCVM